MVTHRARLEITPEFAPSELSDDRQELLAEPVFRRMVCLERKRAERSVRRLVLMLLEPKSPVQPIVNTKIVQSLAGCIRDTDVAGWFVENRTIGVLFTEISVAETRVVETLSGKTHKTLVEALGEQAGDVTVSFYVFPDDFHGSPPNKRAFTTMFPDVEQEIHSRRRSLAVKRVMDIVGSSLLLLLLSPLLLMIACLVRLTSKGPILFRQTRLGQYGEGFTFLKFRSMYSETNHSIHEEYIKNFIGDKGRGGDGSREGVYKLENDPRITKVGAFLRRSSLDELPQLFNVLTGKMSLVGPRPPVPYEFSSYETWHKRRLFVKPGITGCWQVEGRSRVKFDDMVRMDLRYATGWSLWLDIKILFRTPAAVFSGNGAY